MSNGALPKRQSIAARLVRAKPGLRIQQRAMCMRMCLYVDWAGDGEEGEEGVVCVSEWCVRVRVPN